jgi:hypothetical protein
VDQSLDPILVGARLRRWRDELNLTGPDVAGKAAGGLGRPFAWADLRALELGEALPEPAVAEALAGVLGRTAQEVLAAKTAHEQHAQDLADNPDGADDRPQELRDRSPYRPGRAHTDGPTAEWGLAFGEVVVRSALQQVVGGSRASTIAPLRDSRNVLLFSDPEAPVSEGPIDGWNAERTVFSFVGDGAKGDQQMTRSNKALREHLTDRRRLRVFEGRRADVRYAGEFTIDADHPYDWQTTTPVDGSDPRRVLVFRLLPVS